MDNVIVIFGGAGFIGTQLGQYLASSSNARIVSVDRRDPAMPVDGVTYIKADVRDLSKLTIEGTVQTIYNLAAVHTTPGHPTHEYYETNILGATEITAFARRNDVKDIVFTSSISVYGPSEDTKTEQTPPAPTSAYGWSKFLAERIHRTWLDEQEDRRLVICRPAVIFGHGENGNFTRLAKLMKKGFFIYPGRKDTIKACFYVEDLIQAILFARAQPERFVLFNGCYPDRYTLEQIVETLRATHLRKARTFLLPRFVLSTLATILRPFSVLGLGIHPERITKLVKSTDIMPGWLESRGAAQTGKLSSAFDRWSLASGGKFL